jgi:hypothetical protein
MYMAYVKSKRMGSKKRKARKTRRIKGGMNPGEENPIEVAIGMVDKLKELLVKMNPPKEESKEEAEVQTAAQSESKSGDQISGNT